jgi:hypothetical protein
VGGWVTNTQVRVPNGGVEVVASASLDVSARLPAWMQALPGVQKVGNGILEAILAGIKLAANYKLEPDYLEWVKTQQPEP